MTHHLELLLVLCVLALAMGYASWRIFKVLRGDCDPCDHCELKKNCKKFGQSK